MATKIIKQPSAWKPVTIEMTFDTREQLAVWLAFTGNQITMGEAITFNSRKNENSVVSNMSSGEACSAISDLVDLDTWERLKSILKSNS